MGEVIELKEIIIVSLICLILLICMLVPLVIIYFWICRLYRALCSNAAVMVESDLEVESVPLTNLSADVNTPEHEKSSALTPLCPVTKEVTTIKDIILHHFDEAETNNPDYEEPSALTPLCPVTKELTAKKDFDETDANTSDHPVCPIMTIEPNFVPTNDVDATREVKTMKDAILHHFDEAEIRAMGTVDSIYEKFIALYPDQSPSTIQALPKKEVAACILNVIHPTLAEQGYLDMNTTIEILLKYDKEYQTQAQAIKALFQADTNKDGKIQLDEFITNILRL